MKLLYCGLHDDPVTAEGPDVREVHDEAAPSA